MTPELSELLGELARDEISPERFRRLEELLAADPDARRSYREFLSLHVALTSHASALPPVITLRRRSSVITMAAAAAAAALLIGWLLWPSPEWGRVTKLAGAREGRAGAPLRGELFELNEGFAELTLARDVRLVLESPVRLRFLAVDRLRLERGRVVAHVPPAARGFTIETPPGRVVDLGTEFGLSVQEDGATEVQVFAGEVIAAERRLEAGRALRMSSDGARGAEYRPERYVRRFPKDVDAGQPAGPLYNRSRFDSVHVVPAPAAPSIDGDLSDWDASGAFYATCWPPYQDSHTLEGRMMYDERFLYVAARVGDPSPMRSAQDPDGGMTWRGGSVILRLVTTPELGWPLPAMARALADTPNPDRGRRPVDLDERITHLTFWYHRPSAAPRLHLAYGMDFHGEKTLSEGWKGVFKARPDGLGYTIEYAVPWSLLNAAARPPRAGDVLPATWTVHWSDDDGLLSRGFLADVTNLDEPPFRFQRGRCWGKAVFHGRGMLPSGTVRPRVEANPE